MRACIGVAAVWMVGCHLIFPFDTHGLTDHGVAPGDTQTAVLDRPGGPGDGSAHGDILSPISDQTNTGSEICDNGMDDDDDGLVDCSDPQCFGKPHCMTDATITCVAQTCPTGMLCDIHGCVPGTSGICVPDPPSCPAGDGPVCGCDNFSYKSDCLRLKAKVALKHDQGGCK